MSSGTTQDVRFFVNPLVCNLIVDFQQTFWRRERRTAKSSFGTLNLPFPQNQVGLYLLIFDPVLTFGLVHILKQHTRTVNRVSWSLQDANTVLSASQDSDVLLWVSSYEFNSSICVLVYVAFCGLRIVQLL